MGEFCGNSPEVVSRRFGKLSGFQVPLTVLVFPTYISKIQCFLKCVYVSSVW